MNTTNPVNVAEGLWWVGKGTAEGRLECNPYLLLFGGSVILFDPGSVLDIQEVLEKIKKLIDISEIEAVVLSHQDPDLCSSLPILEQHGFKGVICCHERAAWLITFYGISSPFYTVNTKKYRYKLKDGSYIKFLYAPYLHFPGAIMTYLPQQETLISGDLFGAVTEQWTLYAGEDYRENMKTFHESYMPSHEILQSVMNQLYYYDIQLICPQHGSIINKDIREHIDILRDLPCGIFMNPVRQELLDVGGYIYLCSQVVKRYFAIYGKRAVEKAFAKSHFTIDFTERKIAESSVPESQMWDEFFDHVVKTKGMAWLTIVSPLVESLSTTYNIQLPRAFTSIIFDAQKNQDVMNAQYQELENQKIALEAHLHEIEEQLSICPITGMYNQSFFDIFFTQEMQQFYLNQFNFALLLLGIDNLIDINLQYGSDEGDTTMRNLAYILKQFVSTSLQTFRLEGGVAAVYFPQISQNEAIERASTLKQTVLDSKLFITPVTISIGMYHSDELKAEHMDFAETIENTVLQQARMRLKAAKKLGGNTLLYEPLKSKSIGVAGTVLLIDEAGLARDLMQNALEQEGYYVAAADNGRQGLELVGQQIPDIIISELMTPKLSGFSLRKKLLRSAESAHIPFILLSVNKQEQTVKQALSLGISHFFIKPVMLTEIIGVVNMITGSTQRRDVRL